MCECGEEIEGLVWGLWGAQMAECDRMGAALKGRDKGMLIEDVKRR